MAKLSDIQIKKVEIYLLPVETRVPLKFGSEVLTSVTCARICITVENNRGDIAEGWGETPLSVQWVWPSPLSYLFRFSQLKKFVMLLSKELNDYPVKGHPLETGYLFQKEILPSVLSGFNKTVNDSEKLPWLAALVALSPFDLALHDAYGIVNNIPVYETYNNHYMSRDLSWFLDSAKDKGISFKGLYPEDYFILPPEQQLPVWHLVGGLDEIGEDLPLTKDPLDEYPVNLKEWIIRDGLECLKIKLKGNNSDWDYNRIVKVGYTGLGEGVKWLSVDFNCTVTVPDYVNEILDKLKINSPEIFEMILYVEQPFPYDLESNKIDVHSVSARKPLFMDESAHNWELIRLGRELGWTGVALKTCKTQTEALLSLSWAKAHGMPLMVQDLTNPMLAQIPHILLAAYGGTIMGVESNAMQFYPEASGAEAKIHPGLYTRKKGQLDLTTIRGSGFGYRLDEINRLLPPKEYIK